MILKLKCVFIIFFISSFCFSQENTTSADKIKATQFLKKVLKKYEQQSITFQVKKTFLLPVINTPIQEKGNFYIERGKFRFYMAGDPSYLMVFDGTNLWYQSDLKEQIVFQLKEHPHIYLLFAMFDSSEFFNYFEIKSFEKKSSNLYKFHLLSKGKVQGLKEVFLTVGNYVQTSKIVWEDLNQWQEYRFTNPWMKQKFSKSRFEFDTKGFEVLTKSDL